MIRSLLGLSLTALSSISTGTERINCPSRALSAVHVVLNRRMERALAQGTLKG
ncbi:hypothetical protein [Streptomyces sp. NPDC001508]|uniref:hypothetical protein n=1 Tax=Streptomyces sp. NPDC001508 TaxID=3154656 RepID=UPI003332E691